MKVTIPQAVGAVATWKVNPSNIPAIVASYNTASGMSCCNEELVNLETYVPNELQYRKRYELLQQ